MATWYRFVHQSELVSAMDQQEVQPKNGKDFSLAELQEYIGGYIELVYLRDGKVMVVDEEGKLKGLPYNFPATFACEGSLGAGDIICGNALLCEGGQIR